MSAFVCSDNHINAIVTWAAASRPPLARDGAGYSINGGAWTCVRGNEQFVAGVLHTANVEAVNERYAEDDISVGFKFKPYPAALQMSVVQILQLLSCYDYQACELPNYRNTAAAQIIEGIRNHAIGCLPGMDSVKWAI